MRTFSGLSGALYLLGDPLPGGERPRALCATADEWQLKVDETHGHGGVFGGQVHASTRGAMSARLAKVRVQGLAASPGEEVLVSLRTVEGGIALSYVGRLPAAWETVEWHGSLELNDLEEVVEDGV